MTEVLREYAPKFIGAPELPKADHLIEIDRDLHADGLRSVYRSMEDELFCAIKSGKTVAFIDGGTGKTSADVPLLEVGNLPPCGCSPKFLDSIITAVLITTPKRTLTVLNGGTAVLDDEEDITLQILVQNTASAEWLSGKKTGGIQLVSSKESTAEFCLPLPAPLAKRGRARFTVFCRQRIRKNYGNADGCKPHGIRRPAGCNNYQKQRSFDMILFGQALFNPR